MSSGPSANDPLRTYHVGAITLQLADLSLLLRTVRECER